LLEQPFIHRRVPHDDMQHVSTDRPALKQGALADSPSLFCRASDEERGAIVHDTRISSDIRGFNPQLEGRNVVVKPCAGRKRASAAHGFHYTYVGIYSFLPILLPTQNTLYVMSLQGAVIEQIAKFDIFSGSMDQEPLWLEVIEGLTNAKRRMHEIATKTPGRYFVFFGFSQTIMAMTDTSGS
jgi:hypothetical protein